MTHPKRKSRALLLNRIIRRPPSFNGPPSCGSRPMGNMPAKFQQVRVRFKIIYYNFIKINNIKYFIKIKISNFKYFIQIKINYKTKFKVTNYLTPVLRNNAELSNFTPRA